MFSYIKTDIKMLRQITRGFATFFKSSDEAISRVKSGMTVLGGGFGMCGVPNSLMLAITRRPDIKDLTFVSNNAGTPNYGAGLLLASRQTKRMIASYVGENKVFQDNYLNGILEVELTPQGTIAEKLRCAGAGIPVFATRTGLGTVVEEGGNIIKYDGKGNGVIFSEPRQTWTDDHGKKFILEKSIWGDVALIKAWKADKYGNLVYRKTAQSFNPEMAKAGKYVIAEVEEIVDHLDPNHIHTPCVFVDAVVIGEDKSKPVERLCNTVNMAAAAKKEGGHKSWLRFKIAKRAAAEVTKPCFMNLGIGIPTMVPQFVPQEYSVFLQSENGVLGVAGFPEPGQEDGDLIDAAKQSITVRDGASFFGASESFGIIRGAHLDFTMLGGMEVAATGDLANWVIPGKMVKGMGGAMDLVASGSKVFVLMEHTSKGEPKILEKCTLPITGKQVVNKIFTELAVFDVKPEGKGLVLTDVASESSLQDVIAKTACRFDVAPHLHSF